MVDGLRMKDEGLLVSNLIPYSFQLYSQQRPLTFDLYEMNLINCLFHGSLLIQSIRFATQKVVLFSVRRGREEQQKSSSGLPHVCKDMNYLRIVQIFRMILTSFNERK